MNKHIPISLVARSLIILFGLVLVTFCGHKPETQTLEVEPGKIFSGLKFKKIFQTDMYGGWCLALPRGFICSELQDRSYRGSQLKLFDQSGKLVKERRLVHGDGPDEIKVWNFNSVWLSSSGEILTEDNNYLKSLDPETLETETICKLSNMIEGYGSRYTLGRHSFTSLEEKDGQIVTSFESSAFFEDMTYCIVLSERAFEDPSVLAEAKKPKPLAWAKLEENRRKDGKIESIIDYYHFSRMTRTLSADWKRQTVYFFSDIEKPVLESVDFSGKDRKEYLIDLKVDDFKIERAEFDFWHDYVGSETDPRLKGRFTETLYIPPHAPALIGIKVIGDRLFIITGNRDWRRKENEVLVYSLPAMKYEGCFFIPYPNMQQIQWYGRYYITRTMIKKGDDYCSSYEVYLVENV